MAERTHIVKYLLLGILILFAIVGIITSLKSCNTVLVGGNDGIVVSDSTAELKETNTNNNDEKRKVVLEYSEPIKIYGSDYSIMTVTTNYESSSEMYSRAKYNPSHTINVLFFNIRNNDFHLLFDKKLLISDNFRSILSDTSLSRIFYTVISEDTDKDGYLSWEDNNILYCSDKTGRGLTQITTAGVNVIDYLFLDKTNLLIKVSIPQKDVEKNEWTKKYILYNLKENSLNDKNKFNTLLIEAAKIFNK